MDYDLINAIVSTAMLVLVAAGLTAAYCEKGWLAAICLAPVLLVVVTIIVGAFVVMWIDAIR